MEDRERTALGLALLIAALVHILILVLPLSIISLLFFSSQPEVVRAEPLTFELEPQQQQEPPDKVAAPEAHDAATPEPPQEQPETPDPTFAGETNLKRLEAPRNQGQPQPTTPRESTAESGERMVDTEPELSPEEAQRLEEERRTEISEKLGEVLEQPLIKDSDFPVIYNQNRPSSSDPVEGLVQFDTYEWDYVPYRDLMLLKIYREWVPKLRGLSYFNLGQPGRTVIRFQITREGEAINVTLLDGSGIMQYDQAADYAILAPYPGRAAAFPALPEHFPKQRLTVTIGFFVNMTPDGSERPRSRPPRQR